MTGGFGALSIYKQKMFQIQNIDELGLTKLDRRGLEYLAAVIRPIGIGAISQAVEEDPNTIENFVEPWLVRLRLMVKTQQGRQITEQGLHHLGQELQESRFLKA